MNLRSWLYSPSGLFWPFFVLLLPSGIVIIGVALITFLPRSDSPLAMRIIFGVMAVGQVLCWTAYSRVVHYRLGRVSRRVWLVILALCVLISLMALIFGILGVLPVLGALWLFLLVHRAPHWRSQLVPAIYQRRKKWSDWVCPRPYPDDSFDGAIGIFDIILWMAVGLGAAGFVCYAALTGELMLIGKRSTSYIHGPAAVPLAASYLCVFVLSMSVLREYRDKHPDLYRYRIFRWWVTVTGWRLFFWGHVFSIFLMSLGWE